MPEAFDPYRKWLGIPPKDQPPNHYRLLALEPFESDADVIESAADQRMAHVRTYQTGPNSALSQKLLNELSAARICLLDPAKRAQYDAKLRADLAAREAIPRPVQVAQPMPPLPVAQRPAPLPSIGPIEPSSSVKISARPRRRRSDRSVAVAAIVITTAVVVVAWLVLRPVGSPERTAARTDSATTARVEPQKASPKRPRTEKPPAERSSPESSPIPPPVVTKTPEPHKDPEPKKEAAAKENPLSLVASPRPETAGVVADRIVLWNQHNDYHKDRGTRECNVSLWRDSSEVWREDGVEVPWSADAEESVSVAIPPTRFDRLRVEITRWEKSGGGLAEIEVFRAEQNLARGCPVTALASFDRPFVASRLTDGVTQSAHDGYWLLPDNMPGWAEIDLAFAEPRPCPGVEADRLIVWNAHNAHHADRGALELDVRLSLGSDEVWHRDGLKIPWQAGTDPQLEVPLPRQRFDRVRVEVSRWQGLGGGLSEVQVKRGDIDLARACRVTASGWLNQGYLPAKVVDGITSSSTDAVGFWLSPDNSRSWIELDLSCDCAEVGGVDRQLGEYRALVENDWPRGLPWLARGDSSELRILADADARLSLLPAIAAAEAPDATMIGDRWWDIARASPEPAKQALLDHALYHYATSVPFLADAELARVEQRIADSLPRPDGTWLFLLHESEVGGVFRGGLRQPVLFRGVRHPCALWMHPAKDETARATFTLAKKYRRFTGAAAITDVFKDRAVRPVVFKVLADDRELWVSPPLPSGGETEGFDLDVTGVDRLKLTVSCPGDDGYCHAVWIDPMLDRESR